MQFKNIRTECKVCMIAIEEGKINVVTLPCFTIELHSGLFFEITSV